jgi:hypothetical protein
MNLPHFGRLQPVELRSVWKNEARDFTPWLAQPQNLSLLSDTLNIKLVLEATERFVGSFRADIVCRDLFTNRVVLIENQLELTDHSHLGQIFTYAAGVEAFTIIWIAERFREEHRAALDRLNETTTSDINVFGIEIELWQIGDSAIAPNFKIVSQPKDWERTRHTAHNEVSEIGQLQFDYWNTFSERLLSSTNGIKPLKPRPQNYFLMSLPYKGFQLNAFMDAKAKNIGVALMINSTHFNQWFAWFERYRQQIEVELDAPLKLVEAKNQPYVELRLENVDPKDHSQWEAQHIWLQQMLNKFRVVFRPYFDTFSLKTDLTE